LNVLRHTSKRVDVVDFFPDGSDERMYCSPGFNLPVGLIMRTMYGRYPEYHTSLDNKSIISFSTMRETVETYAEVLQTIDKNRRYEATVQYGTPQLSKSPIPLYESTMRTNKFRQPTVWRRQLLDILNYSDGSMDLLQIAERGNNKMMDMVDICEKLVEAGYLREITE
jgi:aminopeptidase-like protein